MFYNTVSKLGRRVAGYAVNSATNYAFGRAKRKIDSYFSTPSKRARLTPVSQRSHISDTTASMRFAPRRSGRTLAMTNLRRRIQRVRTPRRERMRRNIGKYGATNSKSSGFIYTGTRVKRGGSSKVTRLGVSIVQEKGGVLDAGINGATQGNVVAIGHNNVPIYLAAQTLWRAIVKLLFIKANALTHMSNFEEGLGGLGQGSTIRVRYRSDPDGSIQQQDFGPLVGTDSMNTIALYYAQWFCDPVLHGNNNEDLEFQDIRLISSNMADTVLNLRKAVFHFYAKSTLKVQNRTVQDATDDEESVDNVPLYGKAYYGKGSGTSAFTRDVNTYIVAASGFHGDTQFGCIAKVPTEKWYQEPVPASHFIRVVKSGKVHLDPGHIKTSVLDGKFKISVNNFYKVLGAEMGIAQSGLTAADYHKRSTMGHYRFMLLEKMINAVAGTADNGIKVAWETNIRMGGYITTRNETETAQMNLVAQIAQGGEA